MEKDFARHCLKNDRHYRHLHQWLTLPSWLPDGHPYQCKGEHYHRYVKRQLPPPPHSWERRPPRDARVLFYGHSYLGQVGVSMIPPDLTEGDYRGNWKWIWLENNSSLVMIVNNSTLQRASTVQTHLPAFLKREKFTHIVFSQPHKECFFDWTDQGRDASTMCINLSEINQVPETLKHRTIIQSYCEEHGAQFTHMLGRTPDAPYKEWEEATG